MGATESTGQTPRDVPLQGASNFVPSEPSIISIDGHRPPVITENKLESIPRPTTPSCKGMLPLRDSEHDVDAADPSLLETALEELVYGTEDSMSKSAKEGKTEKEVKQSTEGATGIPEVDVMSTTSDDDLFVEFDAIKLPMDQESAKIQNLTDPSKVDKSAQKEESKRLSKKKAMYRLSAKVIAFTRCFMAKISNLAGLVKKSPDQAALHATKRLEKKLSPEEKILLQKYDKLILMFRNKKDEMLGSIDSKYQGVHELQIITTIEGLRKTILHRKNALQLDNKQGFATNPGTQYMLENTGLRIHPEKQDITPILNSAPEAFINAFEEAEKNDRLEDFFCHAFNTADGCLEARYSTMMENMIAAEESKVRGPEKGDQNQKEELNFDHNQSVQENLNTLLDPFMEFKARSVLQDSYSEEAKASLMNDDEFLEKNINVSEFSKFISSLGWDNLKGTDGLVNDQKAEVLQNFVSWDMLEK